MLFTEKALEHRIIEEFPKLAKKHHISDDITEVLMQELSYALKAPSWQSYEVVLSYVQQAWSELRKHLDSPMSHIYFDTFASEVMGLSANTQGLPKYRRYLTASFAAAVRRVNGIPLTGKQVDALETALQLLHYKKPSVEILDKCTDALINAGLDPILSLGDRTEEFLASIEADEEEGRIF